MMAETDLTAWLWATPNSNRVSILFEELGLNYHVIGVNIRRREQFSPEILSLNPYGKIPIIRWRQGEATHVMFESGAILIEFAERHGKLLPPAGAARAQVISWLMVALTGLGPAMGQAHHWTALAPEKPEAAIQHAVSQVKRLYRLLDERLASVEYLAGTYSIADIAAFPWITRSNWATLSLTEYPHLMGWHDRISRQPAVIRGMAVPAGAKLEG